MTSAPQRLLRPIGRSDSGEAFHEVDVQAATRGRELDLAAFALIEEVWGTHALNVKRGGADGKRASFPRRQRAVELAMRYTDMQGEDRAKLAKASALLKEASTIYWMFAERHRPVLKREARFHANKSGCDVDDVMPSCEDAAFRTAIVWDPTVCRYTTALRWYIRAIWQRAPERQGVVVHPSAGRVKGTGFARVQHVSIDAPISGEDGDTFLDQMEAGHSGPAEDENVDITKLMQGIETVLDPREREIILRRAAGETGAQIGRIFRPRLCRERVRQIEMRALVKLRDHMGVIWEEDPLTTQMRDEAARGVSYAELARIYAITEETVKRRIQHMTFARSRVLDFV